MQFAGDILVVLLRLRRAQIDVAFDLEFFARFSTIITYLSGAKRRVGYYLPKLWRGDLLTNQIHFNPYRHVTEVFAALLEPYGLTVQDYTLISPRLDTDAVARIHEILGAAPVTSGKNLIVVNVNASELSRERCWPLQTSRSCSRGWP